MRDSQCPWPSSEWASREDFRFWFSRASPPVWQLVREIARMGADRINRIHCRGYWVHDFQHFRFLGLQIDSDCRDDRFSSACDGDGCLDARVLGAPASEAGLSRCDRVNTNKKAKVCTTGQNYCFSVTRLFLCSVPPRAKRHRTFRKNQVSDVLARGSKEMKICLG